MCDNSKIAANGGCTNCPLSCRSNRPTARGACGASDLKIAKYSLHDFEEPCISYKNGSGTIFFCGCSLKCVFCQNYEASRSSVGKSVTVYELADIFKRLEEVGAENINLVNPTHYIDDIIAALKIYRPALPIVYNSHGYESLDALKKIDGYVDVYLPDMKYFFNESAKRYSSANDYFYYASRAIEFMSAKPRVLSCGKMLSGLIVRHLILPLGVEDSLRIIDWFCTLPESACLSLMSQYTPFGDIESYPELKRKITKREYERVVERACSIADAENRVFIQSLDSSSKSYIPDWSVFGV